MAPLLLFLLTTITTYSLSSAERYPITDKIPLNSSISATQTGSGSSFWLSPSGHFAFGFYPIPSNPQEFIIGIWLEKSSEKPLVWQAIRSDPSLPTGSSLRLTSKGVLVQRPNSNEKSIIDNLSKPVYSASILDNGNFVLLGSDDHDHDNTIWESFENPTDTLLVGQKLNINQTLVSDNSKSAGKFVLRLVVTLQLVVDSVIPVSRLLFFFSQSEEAVFTLADVYAYESIPGISQPILYINETGTLIVANSDVFNSISGSGDFVYRAKLDNQGNFRVFAHDLEKNRTEILYSELDNPCTAKGICGLNSYCITNQDEPTCQCPPGFNFSDPENPYMGCKRIFDIETSSGDGEKSNSTIMVPLQHTAWASSGGYDIQIMNEDECKEACSGDCYCNVAVFNTENRTCRRLNLPLKYGISSHEILRTAFIKVGNSNSIRNTSLVVSSRNRESVGKQRGLFVTGVALVICSAILLVISGFLVCHSRLRREDKIMMRMESQSS